MINKRFCLGLFVIILTIGMMFVGCGPEEKPYPQSLNIYLTNFGYSSWGEEYFNTLFYNTDPLKTEVLITFVPNEDGIIHNDDEITYIGSRAKIEVDDLNWLNVSDFTLTYNDVNNRTLSVASILKMEKRQWGADIFGVDVYIRLQRSALYNSSYPKNGGTEAEVSIKFPDAFKNKYPDGINWKFNNVRF